jgi:hypothetical protein
VDGGESRLKRDSSQILPLSWSVPQGARVQVQNELRIFASSLQVSGGHEVSSARYESSRN